MPVLRNCHVLKGHRSGLKSLLICENRTSCLTLGGLMLSMDRNQAQFAKIRAKRGWFLRFATRLLVHRQ
ncbi:MAG TPA: hypothetical protein DHW36_14550 [Thalassospira sp.]|nr:hypothetical protein [Thalassospira sp.]